jgi:hypothetical protein
MILRTPLELSSTTVMLSLFATGGALQVTVIDTVARLPLAPSSSSARYWNEVAPHHQIFGVKSICDPLATAVPLTGTVIPVTESTAPVSASVSLAKTGKRIAVFIKVVPLLATVTGGILQMILILKLRILTPSALALSAIVSIQFPNGFCQLSEAKVPVAALYVPVAVIVLVVVIAVDPVSVKNNTERGQLV